MRPRRPPRGGAECDRHQPHDRQLPSAWPDGVAQPLASDLNFTGGLTVPNLVVVKLGTNGVVALYNAFGSVDVIVDVVGWYS